MSLWKLIRVFFVLGATGFGASMIPYYRTRLVDQLQWVSEDDFMRAVKIAQALPGLNATNMSVIIGDHLRGPAGAVGATLALLLPGAVALCSMGSFYAAYRSEPHMDKALDCVAAAAAGLLMATAWKLGKPQFMSRQVVLLLTTVLGVSYFGLSLVTVLVTLVPLSIWLHRPRRTA